MRIVAVLVSIVLSIFSLTASAQPSWGQWVSDLKKEAISQGIPSELFDQIFSTIPEPDHKVMHLDKTQPEHRITFSEYRHSRADKFKILVGVKEFEKNQSLLLQIGKQYGVDPCIIVGLWGMESSYGHYMGNFPVIKSLATLAYDERRGDRFRKELLLALKIVNDGQISVEKYKGEWAGASGQPQFLPSSWYKYAVDYDHDGKKDIWTNHADVFASIANYLVKNDWQSGKPVVIEVILPSDFPSHLISRSIKKTVSEWDSLGVRALSGESLPDPSALTSIIQLEGGNVFLIYPNFRVLMTYNYSSYYAATIDYMAREICQ